MPLEINEIGINMRVTDTGGETTSRQQQIEPGDCSDTNREEIVDDCVRRVLEILKNLGGR